MSQIKYSSFEARLHARINGYGTDVPIFTQAFNRDHTPSNPQVIFRQPAPVLSGGPDRGQTSGFPLSAETPVPVVAEVTAPVFSRLFEDPKLITTKASSEWLIDHLERLNEPVLETPAQIKVVKSKPSKFAVELAPEAWKPIPYQEISLVQKFYQVTKRNLIFAIDGLLTLVATLLAMAILLQSFFGWLKPLKRTIKSTQLVGRFTLKTLKLASLFLLHQIFNSASLLMAVVLQAARLVKYLIPKLRPNFQVRLPSIQATKLTFRKFHLPKIRLSLPVIQLPQVHLPKINRMRISLPKFKLNRFKLPKPHLSQIEIAEIKIQRSRFAPVSFELPDINFRALVGGTGKLMIVASIVLFLMTGGPIIRLQLGDWWAQSRIALTGKAKEPAVKEVLTDTVRKPDEVPPTEKQFQLEIPKIGANLRVIPNVDAGDEKAYTAALKLGVAHAAGSALPGETNTTNRTVYIFGHSTNGVWNIEKYNALFYSLKDLVLGDDISIWFWGKEFHYKVTNVVKIDPSDLTYLQPQTLKDQLILQTCWPPGTVWKRLLVIAEPVK